MFQAQRIRGRGVFISFDDLLATQFATTTNIYLIDTAERVYICDTFIGPAVLAPILERYVDPSKQLVVVNSHYHWDHTWGNCLFFDCPIIAHEKCREKMATTGEADLRELAAYTRGDVEIVLPTMTFTGTIRFPDDGITIMHTPGHTADSISVWDEVDQTLFVADNAEYPIPSCIEDHDYDVYGRTLNAFLRLNPDRIVPGHGRLMTCSDLQVNIEYLADLANGNSDRYEKGIFRQNHLTNLNSAR